jgi:hypothetical protein
MLLTFGSLLGPKYKWVSDTFHWFVLLFTASTFLGAGMPVTMKALSLLMVEALGLSGVMFYIQRAFGTPQDSAYLN